MDLKDGEGDTLNLERSVNRYSFVFRFFSFNFFQFDSDRDREEERESRDDLYVRHTISHISFSIFHFPFFLVCAALLDYLRPKRETSKKVVVTETVVAVVKVMII